MARVIALIVGLLLLVTACSETEQPKSTTDDPSLGAVKSYRSVRVPESMPEPVAVSIPAIGVSGRLTETGLNDDRSLEVPEFGELSWFAEGSAPGEPGPAAILGHVDTESGPDVFYRLRELSTGDRVIVTVKGGKKLVFVVDRVEQHAKTRFPTEKVWLPTAEPELRLITCGGEFNESRDSYRDNIIAFASLHEE